MTLEKECAAYIVELDAQSPIVSTSHHTLICIVAKYGRDKTYIEIDRQFAAAKEHAQCKN